MSEWKYENHGECAIMPHTAYALTFAHTHILSRTHSASDDVADDMAVGEAGGGLGGVGACSDHSALQRGFYVPCVSEATIRMHMLGPIGVPVLTVERAMWPQHVLKKVSCEEYVVSCANGAVVPLL